MTPLASWEPSPTVDPLSYPGRIPPHSFVLNDAGVHRVESAQDVVGLLGRPQPLADRAAVLAVGSNAAPARLEEKRAGRPVAALRARVLDHSVVYSAHVSRYGAIASTLVRDRGAECELHVMMFDDVQLERVDRSEGNYDRVAIEPDAIEVEVAGLATVERYASRWGPLMVDGRPIRLAEFDGTSDRFEAWTQTEMQQHVAGRLTAHDGLEAAATVADLVVRRGISSIDLTVSIGRLFG